MKYQPGFGREAWCTKHLVCELQLGLEAFICTLVSGCYYINNKVIEDRIYKFLFYTISYNTNGNIFFCRIPKVSHVQFFFYNDFFLFLNRIFFYITYCSIGYNFLSYPHTHHNPKAQNPKAQSSIRIGTHYESNIVMDHRYKTRIATVWAILHYDVSSTWQRHCVKKFRLLAFVVINWTTLFSCSYDNVDDQSS